MIALLRTPDRRRVVYVTAEKLIRGAKDDDLALRGVAIGELTLATMTAEPPIRVAGDVRRVELAAVGAMVTFRIDGDRVSARLRRGAPIRAWSGSPPAESTQQECGDRHRARRGARGGTTAAQRPG